MEHSPLLLQSYGTPRSHPGLLFEPHISFHPPQIKPTPPIFINSYLFLEPGEQLKEVHLFLQLFHNSEWGKVLFFYGCFPPGRNIHTAGVRLQLFQLLMDLPCRCWEVPYIMEITHISLHPAWKDEWAREA